MMIKISWGLLPPANRFCAAIFAVAIFLILQSAAPWAQPIATGDLPPEKVRQFLELASNPEVKAWLEGKVAAPAAEPGSSIAEAISTWEAAVDGRIAALANAITRVPVELASAFTVIMRDVNSGRPGLVVGILAVLLVVGFGAEWLIRRARSRMRTPGVGEAAGQTLLVEAVELLTFAFASIGSFLAFQWPPLLRKVVLTLLIAFIAFRIAYTIAQFLFAFSGVGNGSSDQSTPVVESQAAGRFWLRRVRLIVGLLLIGWADSQPHALFGLLHRRSKARIACIRVGHSGDRD